MSVWYRAFVDHHPILSAVVWGLGSGLFTLLCRWVVAGWAQAAMSDEIARLSKRIDALERESPAAQRRLAIRQSRENIDRDAREQAQKPQRYGGV